MLPWKRRAIDHVISVSQAVARSNGIVADSNSSIIPNFVPDSLVSPVKDSESTDALLSALPAEPFLLFVGDISREKGVEVLLTAYGSLGRDRPPLLLIGRRTPDMPKRLPDGVRMCFEWQHEDVMAAFRRCLVAILPSLWPDPCPTTVLEGMASGCSLISTSTGGIVDMIVDEQSGLLVAPGDAQALADAIARLLASGDLRAVLAAGARERVREFTASAVVERLETVYRRVAVAALHDSEWRRGNG